MTGKSGSRIWETIFGNPFLSRIWEIIFVRTASGPQRALLYPASQASLPPPRPGGLPIFYSGLLARILWAAVAIALQFFSYDLVSRQLPTLEGTPPGQTASQDSGPNRTSAQSAENFLQKWVKCGQTCRFEGYGGLHLKVLVESPNRAGFGFSGARQQAPIL